MASVVLVTMSACGNSVPDVAPSASTSPSESQAPVQKSPRADAQALVVQACNAYDEKYEVIRARYGSDQYGQRLDGTYIDQAKSHVTFYAKIKPIWSALSQAALEDARWAETLTDLNYFYQVDSGNVASSGPGLDAVYNSAERARMGFFSACQIARSSSRVDLDK